MKLILLILIASCLSCSSGMTKQKDNGLIVITELKGCFNLPQYDPLLTYNDSVLYYLVDVKIINRSDSPKEFITYSCASAGNILVDNKLVSVCINRCSGNGPMIVELKSNQEFSIPVILQTNTENSFAEVKIGWILLEKNTEPGSPFTISKTLNKKRENQEDVVWSEPLYLDASGGKPFEIR